LSIAACHIREIARIADIYTIVCKHNDISQRFGQFAVYRGYQVKKFVNIVRLRKLDLMIYPSG